VSLTFKSPVVIECTNNFIKLLFLWTQLIRVCMNFRGEKRPLSLYIINWLVFITEVVFTARYELKLYT